MRRQHAGLFVAVEGPSGAGKTTLVASLQAELDRRHYRVLVTKEPTESPIGELARKDVERYRGKALASLVAADRYDHLARTIEPALAEGLIVLCDRYVASSLVLQVLDGVDEQFVWQVNSATREPNLWIFLTLGSEAAYARSRRRGRSDRFHASQDVAQSEGCRYAEVARQFVERGWDVVIVDTEEQGTASIASHLSDEIEVRIEAHRL